MKTETDRPCRKCGAEMKPGIATGQTFTWSPDFAGDAQAKTPPRGVTMSPAGPGYVQPCLKCTNCGHSITPLDELTRLSQEARMDL